MVDLVTTRSQEIEGKAVNNAGTTLKKRLLLFSGWIVLSSILLVQPLTALFRYSLSSDDASYLIFIPFICAYVLFAERRKVFSNLSYDRTLGGVLLVGAAGAGLVTTLKGGAVSPDLRLSGYILTLVILWIAGFTLFFGRDASKAGHFALLFSLLMVPLPQPPLDRIIYLLQAGSAWVTGLFFNLFGVPVLREGFVFHLASVDIEVAKECSGIRSSMVLLILALVVAHFYLRSFWNNALFVISGLFMMILKNGIRIASLTLLSMYVDPGFLHGRLHRDGGIVFFLLGLLLLYPVLLFLRRTESKESEAAGPGIPETSGL